MYLSYKSGIQKVALFRIYYQISFHILNLPLTYDLAKLVGFELSSLMKELFIKDILAFGFHKKSMACNVPF